MADTVRTLAQLQTLLATNGTGDISAQDLRDYLVSIIGVYAQVYITGGAAGLSVGTGWTVLPWGVDGEEDSADADQANDKITIGANGDGKYMVMFQCSFDGTASTQFNAKLAVNGTRDDACSCSADLDASSNLVSMSFVGIVDLAAADDLEVEIQADGASKTFTAREAQLVVRRIG